MIRNGSFAKRSRVAHMFNHGWWRLAVGVGGNFRLAVAGGGRLDVGGWRRLVVGGWWRLAVLGSWRLVAVGGWQLAVGGGWRLAVGGPWGRSFKASKKKGGFLKGRPACGEGFHCRARDSSMVSNPPSHPATHLPQKKKGGSSHLRITALEWFLPFLVSPPTK